MLWGTTGVKAVRRMLMKLSPDQMFHHSVFLCENWWYKTKVGQKFTFIVNPGHTWSLPRPCPKYLTDGKPSMYVYIKVNCAHGSFIISRKTVEWTMLFTTAVKMHFWLSCSHYSMQSELALIFTEHFLGNLLETVFYSL